jgi:prolyl oligopeptidase PreP (S9A serine peptidase family)
MVKALLATAGIFLIVLGSTQANAREDCAGKLVSDRYKQVENDTAARRTWIENQTRKTLETLRASESASPAKAMVNAALDEPFDRGEYALPDGGKLLLTYRGLEGGTEIVLRDKKGKETVLLSSAQLGKERRKPVAFWPFTLSPDGTRFALPIGLGGTIDDLELLIFDLGKRKIIKQGIECKNAGIIWRDNDNLLLNRRDSGAALYDIQSDSFSSWSLQGRVGGGRDGFSIAYKGEQAVLINGWNEYELDEDHQGGVMGVYGGEVYLHTAGSDLGVGKVAAIDLEKLGKGELESREVVPENARRIAGAYLRDGHVLVHRYDGLEQTISIYDSKGKVAGNMDLPKCCTLAGLNYSAKTKKLKLKFSSEVVRSRVFEYDMKAARYDADPEREMMKDAAGNLYEVSWIQAKSFDGVKIPVRLVGPAGSLNGKDGKTPVLISSYGGFDSGAHYSASFSPLNQGFLLRGGVLAGPALRGGDEFDKAWWKTATMREKPNTFHDLIATAEALIESKLTSAEKIISTGTSNGGLTVAAASLMRPDLFGLTIPVGGVLDMMARDRLDERFEGWNHEYGDAEEEEVCEVMKKHSPVELAAKSKAGNFLVVTGMSDSRVAPEHSYKFVKVLQNNGRAVGKCSLLAIKNSGHWLQSPQFDGNAGKAQTAIWTAIFDFLGWTN